MSKDKQAKERLMCPMRSVNSAADCVRDGCALWMATSDGKDGNCAHAINAGALIRVSYLLECGIEMLDEMCYDDEDDEYDEEDDEFSRVADEIDAEVKKVERGQA